jgi:hypothetical protein
MNTRSSIVLFAIGALTSLLGCSTPQAVEPEIVFIRLPVPEHEGSGQLVPRMHLPGRVCRLGTSCLTMDPRPFEACLLSTKHCSDKAAEPVLVGPSEQVAPELQEVSR